MAQPKIEGVGHGVPRMIFGNDGTIWIAVLVDALGHIQADILSSVLPTDAATQTTLASCLTALQLIDDLRNALGSVNTDDLQVDVKTSALPTDAATATNQATIITALQLIDDLRAALGSVNTDDLQVDVKTSALPTDAATATNQATMITALQLIDDLRAALGSVNTDDLQVDVKTSALPTDAATATNQATMITALQLIDDLRNALDSVATDELDTHVEGFDPVPSSPVRAFTENQAVVTATWTTIATYTVTTSKTFYLTDFFIHYQETLAGVDFIVRIQAAGVTIWGGRPQGGGICKEHLITPIKATTAQVLTLQVYHWVGSNKAFQGGMLGFEV